MGRLLGERWFRACWRIPNAAATGREETVISGDIATYCLSCMSGDTHERPTRVPAEGSGDRAAAGGGEVGGPLGGARAGDGIGRGIAGERREVTGELH